MGLIKHTNFHFELLSGRFDVHHDMIIRTEESRTMGAKFLDYADLGSREECLRLCCETDGCDVFVAEEKVKLYINQLKMCVHFEPSCQHHLNHVIKIEPSPFVINYIFMHKFNYRLHQNKRKRLKGFTYTNTQ